MIHILVTREHAYTVRHYLQTWGRDVRRIVCALTYEELALSRRLVPGTYIFADLERLGEPQMELARLAWAQMAGRAGDFRLLNDPSRVLLRFDMLQALRAGGINRFAAHRINGKPGSIRFPAFLRRENDHDGAQSPLLHSAAEVEAALQEMRGRGVDARDVLAIEYCETADVEGIYRKYSAFRVGNRIVARHLFHSARWMLKKADLVDEPKMREELDYVENNPHEARLRQIFDLAHIDYGRIDYALLDGELQVWEINTNPTISVPPNRIEPLRLRAQGLFEQSLEQAWQEADHHASKMSPLKLELPRGLGNLLEAGLRQRAAREAGRAFRWIARRPIFTHPLDRSNG